VTRDDVIKLKPKILALVW